MKNKCEYSKIIIPADIKYAYIASKYVGAIAEIYGFDVHSIRKIIFGVKQAVSWVIDYSFEKNERASFEIACELVPEGLKIIIKDKGLPFDPNQPESEKSEEFSIFFNLKKCFDEITFNNLGPDGKEIELVKRTKNKKITSYYNACELEFYEKPSFKKKTVSENISYIVRRMKDSEAIEVSKCIYKTYGYSHGYEYAYYPEKLIELNNTKMMHSAVAVSDAKKIMGHCSLNYENRNDGIAEMALGAVKPEFRSQGCFNKLSEYLIEKARSDKLMGIYVQAVTNHIFSQQVAARFKLKECAINLGYIPATVNFMGFDNKISQRISVLLFFMYLDRLSNPTIYPPNEHRDMILKIYKNMGISPNIRKVSSSHYPDKESLIQIKVTNALNFATIKIKKYGQNIDNEIKKRLKEICQKKIDVISLYLDLSNPLTGFYSEHFEKMGFFFAGVFPGAMGGNDALLFQYLNNTAIDYEKVKLNSEIASDMLYYIKKHDPNILQSDPISC
jgi:anti-sigma regulatory factor (Ser/Thr protein kinase)